MKLLHFEERYIFYFRMVQKSHFKHLFRFLMLLCGQKHGLQIGKTAKIGNNFRMLHPFNITVSGKAIIGDNCTMLKGATVGVANGTAETWGAPVIGDNVYIGLNSSVIGKIKVGDDVLIAPNTLVNKDVPSHSVVIGNPMQIHHKENATRYYIM